MPRSGRRIESDGPGYRLVPIRRVDVYRQVITQIEKFITQHGLVSGDRLPSDRDLAEMLHVSRVSVRQALKVLEGLGRIGAQHGSGTYVQDPGFTAAQADLTQGVAFERNFADQVVPMHRAVPVGGARGGIW